MSTFRRLIGTAQKVLGQQSSGRSRTGGGSDWRSLVHGAADALTGDGDSQRTAHGPSSHRDDGPRRSPRAADSSRGAGVGIPTTSMPSLAGDRPARGAGGGHTGATGPAGAAGAASAAGAAELTAEDRRAIARYDYLVRTAEPDQLESVHREAFERLTPAQREQLGTTMRSELPVGERPRSEDPQDLARSATRLGVLDPRRLTRLLGRVGGSAGSGRSGGIGKAALGTGAVGLGAAGAGAAGLLAAVASGAVLSSLGGSLLEAAIGDGIDVDALAPDLSEQLAGFTEDFEGMEGLEGMGEFAGVEGLDGAADGLGGGVSDLGEQLTGFGDQISDLGLGDLFGR
ncbi:MAG TPA: hypothetical protein H9932_13600 [Candidatus Brachybacterium intestinipullorum]|uniref:Cation-transporting ATPase n=1 Tax=Candidatus Brachybacterium intestinipullorum TaxID=2838512 RepID=A0A9D2Q0N7_9MICO|nr:hypothetical protein [Candidatus Brachybacterium intestinipullorum]